MNNESKIKSVVENNDQEILSWSQYGEVKILSHPKEWLDARARTAIQLAERWALVACETDGEDSAGRQKVRRLTPEELADQACHTVEAIFSQFKTRGWLLEIPDYASLVATHKQNEEENS